MEKSRLKQIYSKTDGYCHLCYKKLSFKNYGKRSCRGNWHVEHSKAKAKGGTSHLNNLYPACISCNLEKGTKHTKTARKKKGLTRAPYSKTKKEGIRATNTLKGATAGLIAGSSFGPLGTLIGGTIGAIFGNSNSPKK